MAVHRHHISDLGSQLIVNGNLPAAGLVDSRNLDPVAERTGALAGNLADILDHHPLRNIIIGDIPSDIVNQYTVAHRTIMQSRIIHARTPDDPCAARYFGTVTAQLHFAAENDIANPVGVETFRHRNPAPILRRTTLRTKRGNFAIL